MINQRRGGSEEIFIAFYVRPNAEKRWRGGQTTSSLFKFFEKSLVDVDPAFVGIRFGLKVLD